PGGSGTQFTGRAGLKCVVYNGLMWVIGGYDTTFADQNDAWSSPDGITWTKAPPTATFPARDGHTSVVYSGAMWVIAGVNNNTGPIYNDVWSSTDGATWTQATSAAIFVPRDI